MVNQVDFWAKYASLVRDSGVPDGQVQWFQRWIERFMRSFRGIPLRERSVEDVTAFLDDLKADEQVAPWQAEQAREALRILYRDFFGFSASTMPASRCGKRRDLVAQPRQLEALHGVLLADMRSVMKLRHLSPRTEETYLGWVRRFIAFHDMQPPAELDASHIRAFLSYLATERSVASSTQNQALNAIVFLYRQVLRREPGDFSDFVKAKVPRRRPDTLSREQVTALIEALAMPYKLMAVLMYGAGLRVTECLTLCVQDVGFDEGTLHVYGKGAKERICMLPPESVDLFHLQLKAARVLFDEDSLHYPTLEWGAFYVFASRALRVDSTTREITRGHINRNAVQVALKDAARRAGVAAHVTPHCLRHSFASHALEDGMHIQTIQELLGHARLSTTSIYAHPMNRPGAHPVDPLTRIRERMRDASDGETSR